MKDGVVIYSTSRKKRKTLIKTEDEVKMVGAK
jgi:hypothetical protein